RMAFRKSSRRDFLTRFRWAPGLLLPAPLRAAAGLLHGQPLERGGPIRFWDLRLAPHYPSKSPLDDMLALVVPGSDADVSDMYAREITQRLERFRDALLNSPPALEQLSQLLSSDVEIVTGPP